MDPTNPSSTPPSQPEPQIQPPAQYTMSDTPYPQPFFKSKLFLIAGITVAVLLFIVIGSFLLGNNSSGKKNTTPTPPIALPPSITPTPIIYPTSYPSDFVPSPTPTLSAKNPTTSPNQSSTSPTSAPTPTPAATTATITGGYYDAATNTPLTDSTFAVAAQSDQSYKRSDDKPTWTLTDLKPGHYVVSINVNSSKYSQHEVKCTNCTLSNIHFGFAEVDLKTGDNIQISWTFDPK